MPRSTGSVGATLSFTLIIPCLQGGPHTSKTENRQYGNTSDIHVLNGRLSALLKTMHSVQLLYKLLSWNNKAQNKLGYAAKNMFQEKKLCLYLDRECRLWGV